MAYNNPYEEDSSTVGSLFKGGTLVGGSVVAWNAIKRPDETRAKWSKFKDTVAPFRAPVYNAAQQRVVSARDAMSSTRAERELRNTILDNDKGAHALRVLGDASHWEKINPVLSGFYKNRADEYTFKELSDVVDIDGKSVGTKVHNQLKKKFGKNSVKFDKFEGTRAFWKIDGQDLQIDFAKRISKSDGWMTRKGEAFYVSPWRAEMVKRGEGKLGYQVMDPNTYILNSLMDDNSGGGRLMWELNDGQRFRDAYEDMRKNNVDHEKVVAAVKAKIRTESEKFSLKEINTVRNLQDALDRITKTDTFTVENDNMKIGLLENQVLVDKWSRYKLGHDYVGLGSDRVSKNAINRSTADGANIKSAYEIHTMAKMDDSLIRVSGNGEDANRLSHLMSRYGGYTLGQEMTAEFAWAARVSTFPQIAEGFKSLKGARFLDSRLSSERYGNVKMSNRALASVRHKLFINDRAEDAKYANSLFVKNKREIVKNRGVTNMALAINPFNSETIQIGNKMSRMMKTLIPKQHSVAAVAIAAGDEAYKESLVKLFSSDGTSTPHTIKEIMESKELSEKITKHGGHIEVAKNTILGKRAAGQELYEGASIDDILERESELVRTKVDLHIDKTDFEQMIVANTRMSADEALNPGSSRNAGGVKWIGKAIEDPAKVALWGARTRGAYSVGDSIYTNQLLEGAGLGQAEGTISLDFFKKTLARQNSKGIVLGKDSPEALHFLQSALGWQTLQEDHNVILRGRAAKRFSGYINHGERLIRRDGSIDLTRAMQKGVLSFKQLTGDKKAFAKQYQDTLQVLGDVRRGFAAGHTNTTITHLTKRSATKGAAVIEEHIESLERLADLSQGKVKGRENIPSMLLSGKTSIAKLAKEVNGNARSMSMGILGGLMPQEHNWLSTGGDFNHMKISGRDMFHFLNKPEILKDLSVHSLTDTFKLTSELELMRASAAGEDITKMMESYEKTFGMVKTVNKGEAMTAMLGGDTALTSKGLKNPEVALKTFMNAKNNKFGFTTEIGDRKVYIPSGDMWRGYMTNDGKATFDNFFLKTHEMLRSLTDQDGEVGAENFSKWQKGLIHEMYSTKEGLMGQIGLKVDHSMYSVHVTDDAFLHNNVLKGAIENYKQASSNSTRKAANTIDNLFGQMAKVSATDFSDSLEQLLSDTRKISVKDTNSRSMGQVLSAQFGDDHFLAKYEGKMNAIQSKSDIRDLVKTITRDQVKASRDLQRSIRGFAETGDAGAMSEIDRITKGMLNTFNVRYPAIYGASYTGTITMVDPALNGSKRVSLGNILQKTMAADFDGDKIMMKWMMSKAAREKTTDLINNYQKEAYSLLKMDTKKRMQGILFGEEKLDLALAKSIGSAESIAATILEDAPMSTAASAYFTKALTGSFNVGALGTKGYIRQLADDKRLAENDIVRLNAFFDNVTSKITEQEVISSKHAESLIKEASKDAASGKVKSILNLIGNGGEKYIKDSVKEIAGVHPLVQMFAIEGMAYDQNTETRKLSNAVASYMDMETGWRALGKDEYKMMYDTLELGGDPSSTGANAARDGAWAEYDKWLTKNRESLIVEDAAYERAGLKDKKLLEVMGEALSANGRRRGGFSSENIDTIMSMAQDDPEKGLRLLRINQQIDTAVKMASPNSFSNKMSQWSRRVVGYDTIQRGVSWMVDPAMGGGPLRMAGAAGLGLVAMTALNVISGDGSLEDPSDLPSVNNPSFTPPRGSGMMAMNQMSPHVGINSNINLLTDNTTQTDSVLNYIGGMIGYQGNTVSVRHDGEDPYKKDLMYYK